MSFKNWLVGSQAAVISLTSARTSVKRDSEKHMEKVVIYRAKMPSTSAENTAALGRDQSCNGLSIYQCRFPLVLLPRIETKLTKTSAANNHLRHLQECSNPASAAILTENLCELSCLLCGVVGWELVVQFYPKNNANTERIFAEQVLAKKTCLNAFKLMKACMHGLFECCNSWDREKQMPNIFPSQSLKSQA